jgi:hypothetical protein
MDINQGSISPELTEARRFAAAMGELAQKGGYIKETVTATGRDYVHIRPGQTTRGKMESIDLVDTANKISKFAEDNIELFSLKEIKNIQSGVEALKERISTHPDRLSGIKKFFISLFYGDNYKEYYKGISSDIKERSFKDSLLDSLANAASKPVVVEQDEKTKMINSFLKNKGDNRSVSNQVEDLLIDKFKEDNIVLIAKLKTFGISDKEIDNEIKVNKKFQKQLKAEIATTKEEIKDKLIERLNRIPKEDLANNEEVQIWVKNYKQEFEPESEKTCEQIIQELLTPQPPVTENVDEKVILPERRSSSLEQIESRITNLEQEEFIPGLIDLEKKLANDSRKEYFNKIVKRTGIVEDRKDILAVLTYLKKTIWGFFVGNQGSKQADNIARSQNQPAPSEAEKEQLDGENTIAHMFYLYNHLETNTTDDPKVSKLKDDLERSLPFAFEIGFLKSRAGENTERKAALSERIYRELSTMKPGQKLFLPIGCEGHATLLSLTKKEDGRVEIQHFNTGFGLQEHRNLVGKEEGQPIAISLEVDLSREGAEKHITEGLIGFINSAQVGKSMEDVTRGLQNLNQHAGVPGGKITASVRRKKTQQGGNCSYRCLLEGIRGALGVDSYRGFKTGLIKKLKLDYKQNSQLNENDKMIAGLSKTKAGVKKKQQREARQANPTV